MTLEEKVKQIVVDSLHAEASQVTPAASFVNDLGADSLDVVEMVMEIEGECGVSIPDDVVPTLETVGDVVNYVESKE